MKIILRGYEYPRRVFGMAGAPCCIVCGETGYSGVLIRAAEDEWAEYGFPSKSWRIDWYYRVENDLQWLNPKWIYWFLCLCPSHSDLSLLLNLL